jgi:hypothetical protein
MAAVRSDGLPNVTLVTTFDSAVDSSTSNPCRLKLDWTAFGDDRLRVRHGL